MLFTGQEIQAILALLNRTAITPAEQQFAQLLRARRGK